MNEEVKIAGRLSFSLPQWRQITSDKNILQAIVGYRLPFESFPPSQVRDPFGNPLFISQERKNRLVITKLSDCARGVRSSQSRNSKANFSHPTSSLRRGQAAGDLY